MIEQLPIVILLAPLFGALLIGLIGLRDHRVCFPIVLFALGVSLAAVITTALRVFANGPIDYFVAGWEEPLGIGIVLHIDAINSFVLIAIATVAILASIFSIRPIGEKDTEKTPYFYILFLLLCVGLFGITITGDAFNLFVLVEVSSLTSYGLVSIGSSRRCKMAAFNYLIMGTVGASFYLIGVGYLYLRTGSLNMQDIHTILSVNESVANSRAVVTAFAFILIGIWVKMAFFPLFGWLPNAYSYSPSSSSCMLAPLMTKVSVYVMIRVMLSVFGLEWIFSHPGWNSLVVALAVIAILAGSVMALAQREIKRMLSYLIVAEIGYMVGGAWLADPDQWGLTGAVYHILADAMMTLCLFLAAGIFAKRLGVTEIQGLGGLFKKMPFTSIGFVIGALGMIGVPPTSGFFSKFYLIRGGIESGHWEFVAALLISSLVNAVLFFRIFEIAFFGKNPVDSHGSDHDHDQEHEHEEVKIAEAPFSSLFPLLTAAALILLLGLCNGPIVELIRSAFEALPPVVSNLR
jgi:multicomponent Na+:H+ antiporter subunit D